MDAKLSAVKWQSSKVYPKGIVLLSSSPADHIDYVKHVLTILRDTYATFKFQMFSAITKTIDDVHHISSPWHLETSLHTKIAFKGLKVSQIVTEMKSLLDHCSVLRRFVRATPGFRLRSTINYKKTSRSELYETRTSLLHWRVSGRSWRLCRNCRFCTPMRKCHSI